MSRLPLMIGILGILGMLVSGCETSISQPQTPTQPSISNQIGCGETPVPGQITVIFNEDITNEQFLEFNEKYNIKPIQEIPDFDKYQDTISFGVFRSVEYYVDGGKEPEIIEEINADELEVEAEQMISTCG